MGDELQQQLRLLIKEVWRWRIRVSLGFALIALLATGAGAVWPKSYSSSTTILVESTNIVDGLMAGRAARGDIQNQYENAREVIYSRSLLRDVLEAGGWITPESPQRDVAEQIEAIRERITVTNPGDNLVQVDYRDGDADQAYETVRAIAQRFLDEMRAGRSQESVAAYEFIDRQVKQYEKKLEQTQEEIRALRKANPLAQPGSDREVTQRMNELRTQIDDLDQEIREARLRETTLTEQLSGEAEVSMLSTALDARRKRIAELQEELDTLRLSYHETYPDVVRIKEKLAELRRDVQQNPDAGSGGGLSFGATRDNPVYQKLQEELYTVRGEINLLSSRKGDLESKLVETIARSGEIQGLQAEYEKLARDYEVNRDIYQDLQRRRENARVSVNLDSEQQGLTLRVSEPAYRPHDASGPRMLHFAVGGMVAGAGIPIGLLFAILLVDPRVRSAERLTRDSGTQVLETIPHMDTVGDRRLRSLGTFFAVLIGVAGVAGVIAALVGRQMGIL
ncbi:XrtA system polysaccharide chain length determinant [Halofilum ochraceum]|uniref:XrtA system polysaccharide chain length determinant n=1 Tax=Halofilum ochraceum TaxID=1611323 RepID=UPI00083547DC|nr:XrtA system polysaccharide chain length determinant [Halofilum ochraceum]